MSWALKEFFAAIEDEFGVPLGDAADEFLQTPGSVIDFVVAVARMVDPDGAGKAPLLIVGGTRESRGVVCSASYEARKYGVRSAMPISHALRLCPNAMCVPVPGRACGEKSREIRAVLKR